MKKSRVAQRMANGYPEWSRVRSDEQSLGHQLLNVFGNRVEDLDKQIVHQGKNYFLPTVNLDEIDLVYIHELAGNFGFTIDETDTGNSVPEAPTVTATIAGTWYDADGLSLSTVIVDIAEDNNIESFWYTSIPSRLSISDQSTLTHTILPATAISTSPITTNFEPPFTPGVVHVTIAGGDTFLQSVRNQLVRCLVTIEGVTRKGSEESEMLVFLANETRTTTKEWKEITSVKVYGVDPDTATVKLTSARFQDGPYLEFYNMDHGISGNKIDTFWDIGLTLQGTLTLDMIRYATEDPRTLLLGFTAKDTIRQIELLDENGEVYSPADLAIQPFSNLFWTCSASKLYVYNFDLSYPNMKTLRKKEYDSFSVFEFDNNYKVLNDDVDITYRLVRPIKEVSRHRASVTKPDGNTFGILNGALIPSTQDYWVDGATSIRELRPSHLLTLDQRGEWIFTLEVEYFDTTKNFDQRVLTVDSKTALRSFSLEAIATGGITVEGIYFDSDQKLWILDSNETKHKIAFATDIMLVDFEQKRIYFKELYDEVNVTA